MSKQSEQTFEYSSTQRDSSNLNMQLNQTSSGLREAIRFFDPINYAIYIISMQSLLLVRVRASTNRLLHSMQIRS